MKLKNAIMYKIDNQSGRKIIDRGNQELHHRVNSLLPRHTNRIATPFHHVEESFPPVLHSGGFNSERMMWYKKPQPVIIRRPLLRPTVRSFHDDHE